VTPTIRKKLAITSPTSVGSSVGIVRSRTQTLEFVVCLFVVETVRRVRHVARMEDEIIEQNCPKTLLQVFSDSKRLKLEQKIKTS
jgi:hypothetical protein